jgi:SH3-like domain-containing protein
MNRTRPSQIKSFFAAFFSKKAVLCFSALVLCAAAPPVGTGPGPALGVSTHLPVPRFVSLRTGEVNFRAGPGFQYPVTWVYRRDGLPVEIIGEFDVWRHVVAPDGGSGWVHEATIRARRSFYVTATQATLRGGPSPDASPVAYLDQGLTGLLLACKAGSAYCKVSAGHVSGYLARADFWGAFPGETVK